jgi:kinesin family protein 1
MHGGTTVITNPEDGSERSFTFDHSWDSFVPRDDPAYCDQARVWGAVGEDILNSAWEGFNSSLFAYGQTGSGKSYSVMGYGQDRGIVPVAAVQIFERIAHAQAAAAAAAAAADAGGDTSTTTFKVEASMLEIYREEVRDLFAPPPSSKRGAPRATCGPPSSECGSP